MNWQNLSYFHEVAKYQNFSHAAKELYITPSALNKAVHALEMEIGIPLFEKKGRNCYLTDYGKILDERLTEAYLNIDKGLQEIYDLINTISGRISLDGIYTMCIDYLPEKIHEFRNMYSDVEFSMEYHITSRILDNILTGKSDIGFCGDHETENEEYADISRVLLMKEELVLIVPREGGIANNKTHIRLEELAQEDFISYRNVNSGINYIFQKMCSEAGFVPKVAFEVPDDSSIVGMVSNGLGIALVPSSLIFPVNKVVAIHFPEDEIPYRNHYMVWNNKRHMTSAIKRFRDFIIDSIEIQI